MRIRSALKLPFDTLAVASGAKSFRHNAVLGSPYLNRKGLHLWRVRTADSLARARRNRLTHLIPDNQINEFEEQGFIRIDNVLPDDHFARLSEEIETTPFPAREMKQGNAVTRFITLSPEILQKVPALAEAVRSDAFQNTVRYIGASNTDPLVTLHTVLTDPGKGKPDPQTLFHSDTFHPTAKAWLFLRDVEEADGPFSFVPGSHRMTEGRLEWEYAQSVTATENRNPHHSGGSFRATKTELAAMGYPEAVAFPVRANTLVVADTHGFHARRPSARMAICGRSFAPPMPESRRAWRACWFSRCCWFCG